MGFRELQKFNDALLAKQVWRLMTNQDSLFFHFFKAKFFLHRLIFYAKENKGSYAWKRILKRRDTIRRGMQWRIGDGYSVRIFQDQWLPYSSHVRVFSPNLDCYLDAKMSSLIDHELRCWKIDVVGHVFSLFEANLVKAIPLSLSRKSNDIFWPRT